ncbi:replication initiator protein RctB domain-containing protein [Photobacterium leiognathi]|uniref:replication initiator protein RctB domain-containing protein n=1 Tax=Photobacterium leiognathi TaxID=553611 RepID=UPI002981D422|nr:replication initiator protein RctB domain-containing protein [Photobacterium leiognathi]
MKRNEISELLPNEYKSLNLRSKLRLFKFNGNEIDDFFVLINQLSLSKTVFNVVCQLLILSKDQKVITFSSFTDYLPKHGIKVSGSSLRRIVKELRDKQILRDEPVYHENELLKNIAVVTFTDPKQAIAHHDQALVQKTLDKLNRTTDLKTQKESLTRRNLELADARLDKNYLTPGVIFSNAIVPKEIHSISPSQARGQRHMGETFRNKSGAYHVESAAPDQVATKEAIATFLVTLNLAIAYNSKMITLRRFGQPFEQPEFPAHIVDILSLRGLKDGGRSREAIRKQIECLRTTIYKITSLSGFQGHNLEKFFNQEDFQFYTKVTSNADEAPRVVNNRSQLKPNLYFLTLSRDIEKELKAQKLFFVLPWVLMKVDSIVLFLYIYLRRNKIQDEVLLLGRLKDEMFYEGDVKKLDNVLSSELDKSGFRNNNLDEDYDYNLCGYYLTKSSCPDGNIQYRVKCNEREMIESTGSIFREHKGNNAPTLINPIQCNTSSEIKMALSNQLAFNVFKDTYVTDDSKRSKLYKNIHTRSGVASLTLTYYDNESVRSKIVTILANELNCSDHYMKQIIERLSLELNPLKFKDRYIDKELFNEFMEYLKSNNVELVSHYSIISKASKYRSAKIQSWLNRDFKILLGDFL